MHDIAVLRDKRGLGFPDAAKSIKLAAKTALRAQETDCDCQITVLLTDDEGIRRFNKQYRSKDASTDVLSFPLNELIPGKFERKKCDFDYSVGRAVLGDVILSLEACQRQAAEYGHSLEREISYLTVHSVLHLLGYDHMDEGEQKKQMRQRENEIMEMLET